jgi:hypothetical protein
MKGSDKGQNHEPEWLALLFATPKTLVVFVDLALYFAKFSSFAFSLLLFACLITGSHINKDGRSKRSNIKVGSKKWEVGSRN